jgi:hypothetical protein
MTIEAQCFFGGDVNDSHLNPSTFAFAAGGRVGDITIAVTIRAEKGRSLSPRIPAARICCIFCVAGLLFDRRHCTLRKVLGIIYLRSGILTPAKGLQRCA